MISQNNRNFRYGKEHIFIAPFDINRFNKVAGGHCNYVIMRVAHKPVTTLRQLLTNVKDKDEPNDRQGAVYKIKCCDCQATYIGETGRNLNTRLTEHKRATRNGDLNNNIAEHHLQTNHRIDWDSAECVIYCTDYYQ